MEKPVFTTLQEWMERTGTNASELGRLAGIDQSHMSKILSRSRRCSYEKAMRLSKVTGVPVENIVRWFLQSPQSSGNAA